MIVDCSIIICNITNHFGLGLEKAQVLIIGFVG